MLLYLLDKLKFWPECQIFVPIHLSRKFPLALLNMTLLMSRPGTESGQLRRMWLQSCCLAATATETRDQGKDPGTHPLCGLRWTCMNGRMIYSFPHVFSHRYDDSYNMWWLRHASVSSSRIPSRCIPQCTCRGRHVPLTFDPWTTNNDHHRVEHKLFLSLLSLSLSLITTQLYIIYYWNKIYMRSELLIRRWNCVCVWGH